MKRSSWKYKNGSRLELDGNIFVRPEVRKAVGGHPPPHEGPEAPCVLRAAGA